MVVSFAQPGRFDIARHRDYREIADRWGTFDFSEAIVLTQRKRELQKLPT
jgi:hypothetical protein